MRAASQLVGVVLISAIVACTVTLPAQPPQFGNDSFPLSGGPATGTSTLASFEGSNTSFPAPTDNPLLADRQLSPFEPAQTLAQVGDQYILRGELVGDANLVLAPEFARIKKLPPAEYEQARVSLLAQRDQVVEQLLQQAIDRKLMYLEFLRNIPKQSDEKKAEEQRKNVDRRIGDAFSRQLRETYAKILDATPDEYPTLARPNPQLFRLAMLMKEADIDSVEDPKLDRLLRENGTSLVVQRQTYMERILGQQSVFSKIKSQPEVTHEQMLAYYQSHQSEFEVPTRARWEQLSALFKNYGTKAQAGDAIAAMGNKVLDGAPLHAVAKRFSQEKYANRGGYHDWTTIGDFSISRSINDAVFSLPLNELSGIIEDEEGLHIIRVLEREEAHLIPFTQAQVTIKEQLASEQTNQSYQAYVAELRQRTPIWTIYD